MRTIPHFTFVLSTSTIDWDDKSEGEIIIENRDDFEVSNIMALDEKIKASLQEELHHLDQTLEILLLI